jgi:hypothetical protein
MLGEPDVGGFALPWIIPANRDLRPATDTEHPTKRPILHPALGPTFSGTAGIAGDARMRNFARCSPPYTRL